MSARIRSFRLVMWRVLGAAFALVVMTAPMQHVFGVESKGKAPAPSSNAPPPAPVERPPTPFEPLLLQLVEAMGELALAQDVCPELDAALAANSWRNRTTSLIEAEATGPRLKGELAGAFNRGYSRLEGSYRGCSATLSALYERDLASVHKVSLDLSQHFSTN